MRKIWLATLLLLFLPLLYSQVTTEPAQQIDAPYITTQLEQLDGSRVSIRFRAVHWDPITHAALVENPNLMSYYNQYVFSHAATIDTNVQIGVGAQRINPGHYEAGLVVSTTDQTYFVVSSGNMEMFRLPVLLQTESNVVPHLSIVFTPGITDRDFIVNTLYGNMVVLMKWRFSGIPARQPSGAAPGMGMGTSMSEGSSLPMPMAQSLGVPSAATGSTMPMGTGMGTMQPAKEMEKTTPAIRGVSRPPAGSGVFRRMFKKNPLKEQ